MNNFTAKHDKFTNKALLKIQEGLTINELDFKEYKKFINNIRNEEEKGINPYKYEEVNVLHTLKDREDVNRNFGMLNVELKYLYVSITRPKTNLIIYDSSPGNRNPILDYWTSQELVEIVHKGEEKNYPFLMKAFEASEDELETKDQWRALGIKLFNKKYFESAIRCFEASGYEDLKLRTLGYMYAEEASAIQSEGETHLYQAKHDKLLTKSEKGHKRKEGKDLKAKAAKVFIKAGEYFEKIKLYKNAAQ